MGDVIKKVDLITGKLIDLIKNKNTCKDVKRDALYALSYSKINNKNIIDTFMKCIKDKDFYIRMYAIEAISFRDINKKKIIKAINICLDDDNPDVKLAAIMAVKKKKIIEEQLINKIINLMDDQYMNFEATKTLFELNIISEKYINKLIRNIDPVSKSYDEIRILSIKSLIKSKVITKEVISMLIKCSITEWKEENKYCDYSSRVKAIKALGILNFKSNEVIEALVSNMYVGNNFIKSITAKSLRKLCVNTPNVIKALIDNIDCDDFEVQIQIAKTLDKLEKI